MIRHRLISVVIPEPKVPYVSPERAPKLCHFGVSFEHLLLYSSVITRILTISSQPDVNYLGSLDGPRLSHFCHIIFTFSF